MGAWVILSGLILETNSFRSERLYARHCLPHLIGSSAMSAKLLPGVLERSLVFRPVKRFISVSGSLSFGSDSAVIGGGYTQGGEVTHGTKLMCDMVLYGGYTGCPRVSFPKVFACCT